MKKILFVDDEPNVLSAIQRQLRKQFNIETAPGGREALEALKNAREYAVVVADMRMPEMNGVEFLAKVKELAPDIIRMMLTGNADQSTAVDAVNEGNIFRFLSKPCPQEKLVKALEDGLRQYQLVTAERELLENTLHGSIKTLAEILAMSEPKSFGQAEALRNNMRLLATALKADNIWQYEVAAMLSRIGFLTVPPETMMKARAGHTLSAKETEIFRNIPEMGSNLVAHIPRLEPVAKMILYQNKHYDGSGFPEDDVAGREIPLGARMLRVLMDLAEIEARGVAGIDTLSQLRLRKAWYDPDVLDAVSECFKLGAEAESARKAKLRVSINFAQLRAGHVLVSDIQTREGMLIISAGNAITQPLLQRLRNFASLSGIREPIYVEA